MRYLLTYIIIKKPVIKEVENNDLLKFMKDFQESDFLADYF